MKKYFRWIILLNALALLFVFLIKSSWCSNDLSENQISGVQKFDSITKKNILDTITIVAVGDIMLGTDYPSEKYLHPSKNCGVLLENVNKYLLNADITFGNLEGVFAGNKGVAKNCINPDQCYVFRMPERFVDCLVESGFDLISVANNHVNDFGWEGRKNTTKVLQEAKLAFAGFSDIPYVLLDSNGIKYGFCAFAPHTGTNDMRNLDNAISLVKMLDSICDITIVSFHAGAEGKDHQHVTRKDEYFLGHNRGNVYKFAHAMIDAGADVLLGNGPHVTRAVELYKDRFIAYSLGNFCTYRRFNLSGPNGYAPILKLQTDKNGKFLKAQLIPVTQEGEGIPKYDSLKRAVNKVIELTKTDFPEQNISINSDGFINLKD